MVSVTLTLKDMLAALSCEDMIKIAIISDMEIVNEMKRKLVIFIINPVLTEITAAADC